ncbi:MAG: FKBP-type peptidyl-prolyl cis-trans isomerase [Cytophagales bacterium]|nr:MAG: FKBP-type peptidyl-prolyl cis-trans isomerase [Cytophagales bacterium]
MKAAIVPVLISLAFFLQFCTSKSAIDTETLVRRDDQVIREYLAEKNIPAQKLSTGIYYQNSKQGTGEKPTIGDTVYVHYTGNIIYSYVFDSSRFKDTPFQFRVGVGNVIPGWDLSVVNMRVGERGTFFIPSYLGYGISGSPQDRNTGVRSIPSNSILIFDIELLEIRKQK